MTVEQDRVEALTNRVRELEEALVWALGYVTATLAQVERVFDDPVIESARERLDHARALLGDGK